jgi:hypothetical protein
MSTGSLIVPGSYQEGSSRAARSARAPTVSQVILGLRTGSAARHSIECAVASFARLAVIAMPASVRENWTTVPPAATPLCTPGESLIRCSPRAGS